MACMVRSDSSSSETARGARTVPALRSSTTTRSPARPSKFARVSPVGPAPMIATSQLDETFKGLLRTRSTVPPAWLQTGQADGAHAAGSSPCPLPAGRNLGSVRRGLSRSGRWGRLTVSLTRSHRPRSGRRLGGRLHHVPDRKIFRAGSIWQAVCRGVRRVHPGSGSAGDGYSYDRFHQYRQGLLLFCRDCPSVWIDRPPAAALRAGRPSS